MAPKKTRGLFRWAGGKSHLIERVAPMIAAHRRATRGRLISLFHGGGAIERHLGGADIAADKSPELLNLFTDLQTIPVGTLHRALFELDAVTPRTPEAYTALGRDGVEQRPVRQPCELSARFLWLLAMAFNGVWRVNGVGQMNMGVDRARLAKAPDDVLPPLAAFKEFAAQIASTKFVEGWENALALAEAGDVLLVDPPYGAFDGYTASGFEWEDHVALATALRAAVRDRGVGLIAFNEATPAPARAMQAGLFGAPAVDNMRGLYEPWAVIEVLMRKGSVSCKADARQPVPELLITAGLRVQ